MRHLLPISALALALIAPPAFAMPHIVSVVPNAKGAEPRLSKPVTSFKAMKFRGMVRQQTDFSCGAAALATIYTYAYDRPTKEREVLVDMLDLADVEVIRQKGFSLLDMKRYVEATGMVGEGYEVPFEALEQLRVPGIALVDIKGYKHFVVIRKVADGFVHMADPALGNRTVRESAFREMWNGIVFVVLGDGYDADSALRNPPPPLSARRLYDQRSPIQQALPRDFDIGRAGTFVF